MDNPTLNSENLGEAKDKFGRPKRLTNSQIEGMMRLASYERGDMRRIFSDHR